MSSETYIFAGGGTGGHLYPGLAVASELTRLRPGAKIVFACSNRDIDRRILDPLPYAVVPQPIRPLPRRPGDLLPFLRAWRASGRLARDLIRDLKPAAVLGLGGFAAAPVVKRAAKIGIRTAMLNPDAVPGKANAYLAKHTDAIFTQFEATGEAFAAGVRGKVRCVGCPIRGSFLAAGRDEAIAHFGLDAKRKTLLVLGGSLGAESVNQAFALLAGRMDDLAETWQVIHITGAAKGNESGGDAQAGQPAISIRPVEYCDRMDLAYAAADVALCRAGASTVGEVSATGTPAAFLPYPWHKDQHQKLNAADLVRAGAAMVIEDAKDPAANAEALAEQFLPILHTPARLTDMTQAAQAAAKPAAAQQVAKWLARG
jgi:UDP-N-acetylglucosamine--N-acetylmuramyl-(pentapeptide) pyrophosphoryl-undecaprenol N-acetylglucosamine transferase